MTIRVVIAVVILLLMVPIVLADSPLVNDTLPLNGVSFNTSTSIQIGANVTDNGTED